MSPVLAKLVRDPYFHLAVAAGPVAWVGLYFLVGENARPGLFLTQWPRFLLFAIAFPLLEEWVFRGVVQPWFAERLPSVRRFGISGANALTTLLFMVTHLVRHSPVWSVLVVPPSLVFGAFRDRYQSVLPAMLLHAFYNLGYFAVFFPLEAAPVR